MHNFDSQTIQLAIIAIAGLAVVMQAIVLFAIFLTVKKATRSLHGQIEDLRTSVKPILISSQDFFTRMAPKIESATTDVADMVRGVRSRTAEFEASTTEILERLQRLTARIDALLSGALDAADRVGGYVTEVVNKPMRQVVGLLASARAVIETLTRPPEPRPTPASTEKNVSA